MNVERIRKRPTFLSVAKSGQKWVTPHIVVQVLQRDAVKKADMTDVVSAKAVSGNAMLDAELPFLRVGFTASRKVGNAVHRNRTKRRMRTAITSILTEYKEAKVKLDPNHSEQHSYDVVLIGRGRTKKCDFNILCADIRKALRKLGVLQK